jgi:hypothetical protein
MYLVSMYLLILYIYAVRKREINYWNKTDLIQTHSEHVHD